MKNLFLLLLFPMLQGCHKYFYLSRSKTSSFSVNNFIKLDSTYRCYIRKVYKTDSSGLKKLSLIIPKDINKGLIEVEYIFHSRIHKNLVYFSTIPDKYQKYYEANFHGDSIVNVYDIRTSYFGKLIDNETISFKAKKEDAEDIWKINFKGDSLNLVSITELRREEFDDFIPLNDALEHPIYFDQINNYQLIYFNYKSGEFHNDIFLPHLKNNILYVKPQKNKKYLLYFEFDRPISKGFTQLYFTDKRIPYNPLWSISK